MKKNNLLKALLVVFAIYVILTWFIPTGVYDNSSLSYTAKDIVPIGIFDLVIYPLITFTSSVFLLSGIVFLLIGGLYGVLNKTGGYGNKLDKIVKRFKGKEKRVLIFSILFFTILSSLTGLTLPLFVLVPFVGTIILLLGFNKVTAILSTVGAILVGNMNSTYGFNVAGYVAYLTKSINGSIWVRVVSLVLSIILLIIVTLKLSKDNKKVKVEEISLYEKNVDKKAKTFPITVIGIIAIIITIIGMVNWEVLFEIDFFNNIHKTVTEFEIAGYNIFGKLIGTVPAMGKWTNYELALVIIISALIIGKIYKLSFKEIFEGMKDGIKEMLPVAAMVIICNIIFLLMNANTDNNTIYNTMINAIFGLTKGFNIFTVSLASIIGSIFFNDFPYLFSSLYAPVESMTKNYVFIGIIVQLIHGFLQLIVPTSAILVAGLSYFKVDYLNWLKNIWKLIIGLIIIIAIIFTIVLIFV